VIGRRLGDTIFHHSHERRSAHGMVRTAHQTYPHAQRAGVRNWPTPCLEIWLKNGPLLGTGPSPLNDPGQLPHSRVSPEETKSTRKTDCRVARFGRIDRSSQGCHCALRCRRPTRAGSDGPSTGHSEKSPLIAYVSGKAPEAEMPPSAGRARFRALSPDEVALLRAWIEPGAEWPAGVLLTPPKNEKQP
jgi:hypothetical protein